MHDYAWELEYRTRSAELQDIAAMDRLAAQAAPAAALRRYARDHGELPQVGSWARLASRLGQLLHGGTVSPTSGR